MPPEDLSGAQKTLMSPVPVIFNLRVSPVPLLNVRMEFNRNRRILTAPELRAQISQWKFGDSIHGGYIIWGGEPSSLLTWFLQRTVIGLEAYIPPAVLTAAIHYRRLSSEVVKGTKDPSSLRAGRTHRMRPPSRVQFNRASG